MCVFVYYELRVCGQKSIIIICDRLRKSCTTVGWLRWRHRIKFHENLSPKKLPWLCPWCEIMFCVTKLPISQFFDEFSNAAKCFLSMTVIASFPVSPSTVDWSHDSLLFLMFCQKFVGDLFHKALTKVSALYFSWDVRLGTFLGTFLGLCIIKHTRMNIFWLFFVYGMIWTKQDSDRIRISPGYVRQDNQKSPFDPDRFCPLRQWFPNCGMRTCSGTRQPSRWCTNGPTLCFCSQKVYSQI